MKSWDNWKEQGNCYESNTENFFDNYENDVESFDLRRMIDEDCITCPVVRVCFAVGKFQKAWGVWGGVYMEDGETSDEFNNHKTPDDWARLYGALQA